VFDAQSGQPRAAVALGAVPSRITAGLGAQWATSYDNGTLLRVDPSDSAVVQTVYVGHGATGVAVAAGDVWVADTLDNRLTRVDGRTDQVVQQIPVGASPRDVAAGAGSVWVSDAGDGTVSRVDPLTGALLGVTRVGPSPSGVAVGSGAVWVALSGAAAIARLDPGTGRLLQTIHVGLGPSAIAVGRDGVWVANELDSTVSLINSDSASVTLTRAVPGTPTALAADRRGVWVTADAPLLTMVRASGQTQTVAIPSPATALAASPRGLLAGVSGTRANHRGGTLVMRVTGPIDQINPEVCCSLPPNVRILSYDSLLGYSKSPASPGTLVPDLALAIPAAQNAGLSYTFRLRPGVRYGTGAPIRASDFRRGLERAAQNSSTLAAYIGVLRGALACPYRRRCDLHAAVLTNDRTGTVMLRLAHPDPELLPALGLPYFAPAPAGSGIRPGTGPYRVARFVPGQLIDFERNPYFREWAPAAQPAGYPARILVYSNGTASANIAAVLSGRADYTFDTPTPSQLKDIELRSPGLLHTAPLPDTDFLDLNTHAAPFNDLRVRQAVNFAVNRGAIAGLYGGLDAATPSCQIIPVAIPGHVSYCPYTRDPSRSGHWTAPNLPRARQLIAASGTRGAAVTVLTQAPSGPWDEPVGRYIVGLLRQLGYRARVRVLTPSQRNAAIVDYRHPPQIATDSWTADFPSASQWITLQLSCAAWHPPTQVTNHALFCDPTADRWAAQASQLQLTNPIAAIQLWARADRRITNLAPWLTTVAQTETDLVSPRVGNYQYVPTIGALLDQLWVH
jgi:peptide/nickel transport system substrate-binding protein